MGNEEIEELVMDFIEGDRSDSKRKLLEDLFARDSRLKEETMQDLKLWKLFNRVEDDTPFNSETDIQFYALLQRAKVDQLAYTHTFLYCNRHWVNVAAVIIFCLIAFSVGRFTKPQVSINRYQTVFVKVPLKQNQLVSTSIGLSVRRSHKTPERYKVNFDYIILNKEMQSLYASKRIMAIVKITERGNLNDADLKILGSALKGDPNPNVRLTILNALRPLSSHVNVQAILLDALNKQDDETIQTEIIDMLINAKSKQAIPRFIAMLDDKKTNMVVQSEIKTGIENFLN
jgi:hypothetical protein